MKKSGNSICTTICEPNSTTSTVTSEYVITRKELAKLVGLPDELPDNVSVDITAFVTVPGGGDWSHARLNIDDHPIQMNVTVTTVVEIEGENS